MVWLRGLMPGPCRWLFIGCIAAAASAVNGAAVESDAGMVTRGHQLLQTQLAVGRSEAMAAVGDTVNLDASPRKPPKQPATSTLANSCLMVAVLMQFAVRGLARLIFTSEESNQVYDSRRGEVKELSKVLTAADALASALALAAEGACTATVTALLPDVAGGRSRAWVLVLARPIAGVSAAILLPLLFRKGGSRGGRFGSAAGLALLTASCLCLVWATALWGVMLAHAMGAVGSALVLGSAVQTAVSQVPRKRIGWRLNGAMYGLAVGTSAAPLLGSALSTHWGGSAKWMLVGLAWGTGASCCAFLTVSGWVVDAESRRPWSGTSNCVSGDFSTIISAVVKLFRDSRLRLLLVVCGASAAALSLHGALLPLYLRSDLGASGEGVDYFGEGPSGGAAMGITLLVCGLLVDFLPEASAASGLVGMAAVGALGLRAIAIGKSAALPNLTSLGLLASQSGIGGLLGLALPLLVRRLSAMNHASSTPMGHDAEAELVAGGAVVSGAVSAAWLAGEGIGAVAQTWLWRALGSEGLISAVAVGLVALAAAVLAIPGWFRGAGSAPESSEEVGGLAKANLGEKAAAMAKMRDSW